MPHFNPAQPFKPEHHLPLKPELVGRLAAAYATSRLAWERDPDTHWRHTTPNEFLAALLELALDRDGTFEGSKVALANKVGRTISDKLDTQLLLLYAILDLLPQGTNLSDDAVDNSLKRAVADPDFEKRVRTLRDTYQALNAPETKVVGKTRRGRQ